VLDDPRFLKVEPQIEQLVSIIPFVTSCRWNL
jgi:hypothetical protein